MKSGKAALTEKAPTQRRIGAKLSGCFSYKAAKKCRNKVLLFLLLATKGLQVAKWAVAY